MIPRQAAVTPLLVNWKGGVPVTPYEIVKMVLGTISVVILAVTATIHLVEFLLKAKIDRPSE